MADERLDVRLARETGLSRSRVERLIQQGHAKVDGREEKKAGRRVGPGETVTLAVPPPAAMEALPEALPLEIIYEDAHLAVVNKPAGMVVHPAAGNERGTLVNALLHHVEDLSGIGGTLRPGIVHRLDKDTSGLLLVAKGDAAHQALSEALKNREIHKTYQAVVLGHLREEEGRVEAPIGRSPKDRKKMAVVEGGRHAVTEYAVMAPLRGADLVRVHLVTGRTHQIRVHFQSLGHPLLGDPLYGGKKPPIAAPRLMLHAWRIAFAHPVTGEAMAFEAPPPEAFGATVRKLEEHGNHERTENT